MKLVSRFTSPDSVHVIETAKVYRQGEVVATVRELTRGTSADSGFFFYYPFGSFSKTLASETGRATAARIARVHELAVKLFREQFPDRSTGTYSEVGEEE